MKLHYVATNELVEYVLTKPLSRVEFEYFIDKFGLVLRKREKLHADSGNSSRGSHLHVGCGLLYSHPV